MHLYDSINDLDRHRIPYQCTCMTASMTLIEVPVCIEKGVEIELLQGLWHNLRQSLTVSEVSGNKTLISYA